MKNIVIVAMILFVPLSSQAQTRSIGLDRVIPPYVIEVAFEKTVHIIFPAPIRYVDLGSANIIAGKAGEAENVLRVKAAVRDFETATNFAVICEDGSFYSFNVRYAEEPQKLNFEMRDFIHDGSAVNRPNNAQEVFLTELGNQSPTMVRLIMRSIHDTNSRRIKHIGSQGFGIQCLLKGIYTHQDLIYFHTQIRNRTNITYDIDFIRFKIVDKKIARRTAIQETVIVPVRAFNYVTAVDGKKREVIVLAFDKFTIPDDKILIVEMFEKNGGRHQSFVVENADLMRARVVNELRIK